MLINILSVTLESLKSFIESINKFPPSIIFVLRRHLLRKGDEGVFANLKSIEFIKKKNVQTSFL